MIGRRAFASKLIKDSNVDIRHRLAKILASASSSPVLVNETSITSPDISIPPPVTMAGHEEGGTLSNYYCDTPINDQVDPIDYEDYIVANVGRIPAGMHSILLFPPDDIEVEKYQPLVRTLEPTNPEINLHTSEDPYFQSVGTCVSKSLVVTKKYEKCSSVAGLQTERHMRYKSVKRQEYEVDLGRAGAIECDLDSNSETPLTFYSRQTSVKNTPRPQSLISSSSTVRPPLASDEEDFSDEDEENGRSKTPVASDTNSLYCDIPSIDTYDSIIGESRNSRIYVDTSHDLERIDAFGSKAGGLFTLQNTQPDPHIYGILEKDYYDHFFDNLTVNYNLKESRIFPIFTLHPLQCDEEQIESRPSVLPPSDVTRYRFLVKCFTLKLELEIEPIFASIAIYDAKERKKVTENFYFDLNPDSLKRQLRTHINYQDLSTLSRSAIFSLSQMTPDMYIVVKLEKVLQSELNDLMEAYSRPPEDVTRVEKLKVASASCCERLGRYRMLLAWTAFPLVDILSCQSGDKDTCTDSMQARNNSSSLDSLKRIANECTSNFVRKGSLERHSTLTSNFSTTSISSAGTTASLEKRASMTSEDMIYAYSNFKPVTINSKIFYRYESDKFSDDDLYKFLQEYRKPSFNAKRLRCFPGALKMDVSPVREESAIKCRVNPELVRLHPYNDERVSPVKEILEFRELLVPHLEHLNLLYVYPKSLNFTNRQGSARNLSIKVQLLSSEEKFSAMSVIFGKSSCPEATNEAYTAVNYHNRSPTFTEEFKIRLPAQIDKQTHLFFTILHVHTKPKSDVPVDEVVGYTWLPLWRDDCLQTGVFQLPVLCEPPSQGYSFLNPNDSDTLTHLKWIDCHKPLLVVQLDSYSSIFAQDPYVDRFFRITSSLDSQVQMSSHLHSTNVYEEFSRAISGLASSNLDSLVKFVHIILNRLVLLLVRPPPIFSNQSKAALTSIRSFQAQIFETIVLITSKINSALYMDATSMRSGILATYIQYQAIFPQPEVIRYNHFEDESDLELLNNRRGSDYFVSKSLHEEVINQWLLLSSESTRDKLFDNSYFFYDLIFKSLCVSLSLNNTLRAPARSRATKSFLSSLTDLVTMISDYLVNEMRRSMRNTSTPTSPQSPSCQTPHLFHNLNHATAFFVRDLISVLDRHFVFNLIKTYVNKLSSTIPNSFAYNLSESNGSSSCGRSVSDSLFELRVDFLRVLGGHEHFVALNLPFGTSLFQTLEQTTQTSNNPRLSPSSALAKVMLNSSIFSHSIFDRVRPYAELTDDYRRHHWILGLIFCTLVDSFTRQKSLLQSRAANLIRSLLTSLDWDIRYKDSEVKTRIACLFLPLVGIIIDVISQLHDPNSSKDSPFYSADENQKYLKRSKGLLKNTTTYSGHSPPSTYGANVIDNTIAMAIAGSVVANGNGTGHEAPSSPSSLPSSPVNYRRSLTYQPISQETTRTLLACFLWVLGNVDHRLLSRYLSEFSNERLLSFLELLRLSMKVFEYEGERSIRKSTRVHVHFRRQSFQKLEEAIRYGTARRELMRRRDFSQSFGASDSGEMKLRWRKDSTLTRYNSLPRSPKVDLEDEVTLEGHLSTMMNLIVVDTITLILAVFRERIIRNPLLTSPGRITGSNSTCNLKNKYASDEFVVGSALQVLLQLLSFKQSTMVLEAAFHTQRALLHHFPDILFVEGLPEVDFCSELCYLLLKHCASRIAVVRAQASASLYLLKRQYHLANGHSSRIKIQVTMSLSQLVGTSPNFNEVYIRRALNSILLYALVDDSVKESQFPEQVKDQISNLLIILSNTMQMKEHEQDSEMLLDLMYRLAKSYQNSPELRLTWLQNMANKHAEQAQHVEAAQCYVHAAALVAECLHRIARRAYLPVSCAAFQRVCPNVFEESLNANAEISMDKSSILNGEDSAISSKKGVQSARLFGETGLVNLLEKAASHFDTGGMYEAVNEAYKLLIPVHEAHHRYSELAKVHSRLHDVFIKIEQQEGKRVFATFFRVGFYGSRFSDLDHQEFVYKEPFLTKLPEIAQRLESFYSNRFGADNVEVIKDSNQVDVSKLNQHKAYIQITYVEPYFDSWEIESRHTCYERNYNIKRFIYSTPFTFDGRAHGQLYEQCKRKTILTTEHSFPYVKTRVQVQDRHQMVLSPIEVAIEDVQKKTNELAISTHQEPVDAKILQMVLQGCVGTTVNQGPAEIAFVFLGDQPNMPVNCQRPPPGLQSKLRIAFKEFCMRCGEALTKNRQLVNGHEQQIEYHKELERNFYRFTERLAPLMGNANTKQSLVMLRESYFIGLNGTTVTSSEANSRITANGSLRHR